ncbi:MAG: asparagine synthetase B [Rhodothermia bacterium]
MKKLFVLVAVWMIWTPALSQEILIPMDSRQTDHLKAYGVAFWVLQSGRSVDWLLNYRGGSFLTESSPGLEQELRIRDVYFESVGGTIVNRILAEIADESANMDVIRLEKAPRIAVYAPEQTLPWDDAVLLALTYAEVPFTMIYDDEVLGGKLREYDWVHLHHEDFTGQLGKFYAIYRNQPWYQEQLRRALSLASSHGYKKISQLKLAVAQTIRQYVFDGGFLFAMCSGTDTFDIALAAANVDIVPTELDGDPVDPDALERLDFSQTLAFENFTPNFQAMEYEHSDIDVTPPAALQNPLVDYFTLFEFSAKWDPVPTMLTQNHVSTIKGFMGQTTAFNKSLIKQNIVVLAEAPGRNTVRYLHGSYGMGTLTFYSGHDPEDYKHLVGDPPTDLALHKNSPGYRLILNNILFPAAKKKKQKT